MRGVIALCALLVTFATPLASVDAQPRTGLSPEALAVYRRWVLAMCIGGDERALAADLRRFGGELVAAFQGAIAAGPTPEDVRAASAAAAELYDRRAKTPLEQMPISGISADDLKRFRNVSREAFVQDQVRRFVTGYRANAIAALGVIADPRARDVLARIAVNARDPLAEAAREALKGTGPPP